MSERRSRRAARNSPRGRAAPTSRSTPRMRAPPISASMTRPASMRPAVCALTPDDDGVHRGEVAGVARGNAIRLPRRWPLPALAGPSVRHLQAVGRPLCGCDRPPLPAAPFDVRAWRGQRTVRPQMHSVAGGGGRGGPAARRMGPHNSLRTQRTRLHPHAAGYPGAHARSLRRTRAARGHRASGGARRHQRRNHAVRRIRRRASSAAARARQRLGL